MNSINPKLLKKLPKTLITWSKDNTASFRLTKMQEKRESMVLSGRTISGMLSIVDIQGSPAIKITSGLLDYIRTSPFVKLINETPNSLTFETEGGFYHLEKES